jgi:hypothetical protein
MRIRPYIESRDYEYIEKWIDDEKTHALWCANLIPYPVTKENFHAFLETNAVEWTDSAYVATETNGEIIGFFCYSINVENLLYLPIHDIGKFSYPYSIVPSHTFHLCDWDRNSCINIFYFLYAGTI